MTVHHRAKRVFELSDVLGLHLPTEIEISLAFTTSHPWMFAKTMKAVKKNKQNKKQQPVHRPAQRC